LPLRPDLFQLPTWSRELKEVSVPMDVDACNKSGHNGEVRLSPSPIRREVGL